MDKVQLDHYKQLLLSLKTDLEAQSLQSHSGTETVVLDQTSVGRLSRMDALQGQQMALEAERRRKLQLRLVGGALTRINSGDYGYCVECGDDIAPGRLAFNPAVSHCIDCSA